MQHSSLFAFLRVHDLVFLLLELGHSATCRGSVGCQANVSIPECPTCRGLLLSLQLVCKGTRDALGWHIHHRRYRERQVVSYILTGCDGILAAQDVQKYSEQQPLRLPYINPPGFSLAWRVSWSAKLRTVDLSLLCRFRWCEISPTDLPLDFAGKLFPNARSLTIGEAWGGTSSRFSKALHRVADLTLPSNCLEDLSLHAHLSDMTPILARASTTSSLTSLRLSSSLGEEPGCSSDERLSLVVPITRFVSLRILAVPSALFHRDTLRLFAGLPSLQVLHLVSRLVRYSEWQDAPEPEKDDWSLMDPDVRGFTQLEHLYLDGAPPDQLVALASIGSLLPAARTLTLRASNGRESAGQYIPAFKAIGRTCKNVRTLNLGLAALDGPLLQLLAGLNPAILRFLPTEFSLCGSLEGTVRNLWPKAEIVMKGYDDECRLDSLF